jgi:hypothetical protein
MTAIDGFREAAAQFAAQPSTWAAVFLPLSLSLAFIVRAACLGRFPPWVAVVWVGCVVWTQALSVWVVDAELRSLHTVSVFTIAAAIAAYLRVRLDLGLVFGLTHLALLLVDITEAARYAVAHDEFVPRFFVGIGGAGLLDGLLLFPAMTAAVVAYSAHRAKRGQAQTGAAAAVSGGACDGES